MLIFPKNQSPIINVIGIDPGSTHVGIARINFNLETGQITNSDAWSINGAKLAGKDSWLSSLYGDRYARIHAIKLELIRIFYCDQPAYIASESPFINAKFPAAGMALVEVLSAIKEAICEYDFQQQLLLIPPSNVKNAIGVGGGENKISMLQAIMKLPDLCYSGIIPIHLLDEHAVDALAVGYRQVKLISGEIS